MGSGKVSAVHAGRMYRLVVPRDRQMPFEALLLVAGSPCTSAQGPSAPSLFEQGAGRRVTSPRRRAAPATPAPPAARSK